VGWERETGGLGMAITMSKSQLLTVAAFHWGPKPKQIPFYPQA